MRIERILVLDTVSMIRRNLYISVVLLLLPISVEVDIP